MRNKGFGFWNKGILWGYCKKEEITWLEEVCGLKEGDTLIVSMHKIYSAMESIYEAKNIYDKRRIDSV